jgi:glyoxylase-like metal-dependent hydrolase (beta-lactamase superfamily II)
MLPVRRIEMPTPYAIGPVNAYLIEAEPVTLIDAGVNTPQAQNALKIALAAAGMFPESIEQILVTHAHPDHYGLVHVLQEASNATVFFPEREIARVRDRQMLFEVGRLLVEAGMPLELLFKMDQQRRKDPRPGIKHEEVVPVKHGDRFELHLDGSTVELQAILSPGHTGGHVVYHYAAGGTLFAGDQLLPDVSPNPLLEPSLDIPGERRRSLREYLDSLEKLGDLGLQKAYPGHGAPIDDPQELIGRTIEHHLKRKAQLAARLGPEPRTPYELALEIYPDATGYDSFLAVSEIVAHLDLVVEDGRGVVEVVEGVTYYRAA